MLVHPLSLEPQSNLRKAAGYVDNNAISVMKDPNHGEDARKTI